MRERDGADSPKSTSNDTIHKVKPNTLISSAMKSSKMETLGEVDESRKKLNMKTKLTRDYKDRVKKKLV
jgi:hypothetical protein